MASLVPAARSGAGAGVSLATVLGPDVELDTEVHEVRSRLAVQLGVPDTDVTLLGKLSKLIKDVRDEAKERAQLELVLADGAAHLAPVMHEAACRKAAHVRNAGMFYIETRGDQPMESEQSYNPGEDPDIIPAPAVARQPPTAAALQPNSHFVSAIFGAGCHSVILSFCLCLSL